MVRTQQIKVFVSTTRTQGQRTNDFCFVPQGEVVTFPLTLCSDHQVDDGCGCSRSLIGTQCLKGTTTMEVAAFPGGKEQLAALLLEADKSRFGPILCASLERQGQLPDVTRTLDLLLAAASRYPIGAIVEWRNGQFIRRNG